MANWNPFQEIELLRQHIDRAFDEFGLNEEPLRRVAFLPGTGPRRYPLMNLLEEKDSLYIEALTPGVDPKSIDVTIVENRLTISGEKSRTNGNIQPEAFHRNERASGRFVRTVDLPVTVNEAGIQAEYKNGLLILSLPKAEKAKPKQINVKVS